MVYVHIPFCRSFCIYCDFYSGIASDRCIRQFADEVCEEIARRKGEPLLGPDTLYIGGGTPSVLPFSVLQRIVEALGGGPWEEFTLEVNPDDVVKRGKVYVEELKSQGVNRVSMGVQSFDQGILKWMNRRHSAEVAVEAFRLLREGGIGNISIDLIFGFPMLTDSVWKDTIRKALSLPGGPPEHISCYQLSVEPDSELGRMEREGLFVQSPEEDCRRQYETISEALVSAGYHHYEISNFALPGKEAVHNSAYWTRVPYQGFGPGAHSFDGTHRFWNTQEIPWKRQEETLTDEDALVETIMLSLRTDKGIDSGFLHGNCSQSVLSRLMGEGLLEQAGGRVRIPRSHWFISDSVIRELV